MDTKKAKLKFTEIRDIPYRIPLEINEVDNCCVGKHIRLKKELEELGYEIRYRTCSFKWSDFHLPEKLQNIPHENDCTHLYLEFKKNNVWETLDATWDQKLTPTFQINGWDGKTGTKILVPSIEILSTDKSIGIVNTCYDQEVFDKDIKINGDFYNAFNIWLESLR
jgi:hypothetical protein